jgi:pSer/pThr/pTyr-binding forkhead associated (FHA) protein
VRAEANGYRLVDLGSTNGVIVNERPVREHDLVDNDHLKLGHTEFKFKSIS